MTYEYMICHDYDIPSSSLYIFVFSLHVATFSEPVTPPPSPPARRWWADPPAWHPSASPSQAFWEFEKHRLEPTNHLFFQKDIIAVIIKIISKFSPAWTVVFVHLCGLSLKFSPKDHGHPDSRTWRWAYRAAAALFRICKKMPKFASKLAKSFSFRFIFDLLSLFRFFRFFFPFSFSILVVLCRF